MTSTLKTTLALNLSGLVDGESADASDVLNPLNDALDLLKAGQLSVNHSDTHLKHLEDALTVQAPLSKTLQTPTSNASLLLKIDSSGASSGQVLSADGAGGTNWQTVSGGGGGGTGTVTSVALSAPSDLLLVAGSPVTSSGTLALSKPTSTPANLVYASPNGTAGAGAFRALLEADIPSLSGAKIGSGTVAAARLGLMTGATLSVAGTSGAVPQPIAGDNSKFLRGDGTWAAVTGGAQPYAVLENQQAQNVNGGAAVTATWTTREINTEVSDPSSIVALSGNQFTPIAGTYLLIATMSVGHGSNASRPMSWRVRNVTASTDAMNAVNADYHTNALFVTQAVSGIIVANGTDAFALQYRVSASMTLGTPRNISGELERYVSLTLVKIG